MTSVGRDRLTLSVYGYMAVFGYFLYGFGPAVVLLRDDQNVSRAVSGLHGTALALGAILAGLFGAAAVRRWGRSTLLRAGMVGLCVGVLIFTLTRAVSLTLLGALVAGTFGSVIVNTHSTVLTDRHDVAAPAAINEANAGAALTGLVAPAVIGAAVVSGVGWRAGLLVVVALGIAALLYGARVAVPDRRTALDAAPVGVARPRLPPRFWAAWGVLVLCISVEFSFSIWTTDLLRERVGLRSGAAAALVSALVLGVALGRVAGGRLALRFTADRLLLAALGVTSLGFCITWLSTLGWLSALGLVVVGLGIALQFPLGISRVIRASAGHPDVATARASLGAGLAIGLGPFALGFLADTMGTHRAFLLVPVLLLAATVLTFGSRVTQLSRAGGSVAS